MKKKTEERKNNHALAFKEERKIRGRDKPEVRGRVRPAQIMNSDIDASGGICTQIRVDITVAPAPRKEKSVISIRPDIYANPQAPKAKPEHKFVIVCSDTALSELEPQPSRAHKQRGAQDRACV